MLPKAFEPAEGKSCSLERVRVLDGEISVRIRRENGRSVCEVENQTSAQMEVKRLRDGGKVDKFPEKVIWFSYKNVFEE